MITAMNLPLYGKRIFLFLLLLHAGSVTAADQYDIVIIKSKQKLDVVKGEQVVKQYHIAYGKGGNGHKQMAGDGKTPIGTYRIVNFRDNSQFHYFMQLDYPNLLDAWYGYKNRTITATEFKEIARAYKARHAPPQNTRLGGNIGIHGLGKVTETRLRMHEILNWTNGCIALTNDQINELRQYVTIGTRVVIRE